MTTQDLYTEEAHIAFNSAVNVLLEQDTSLIKSKSHWVKLVRTVMNFRAKMNGNNDFHKIIVDKLSASDKTRYASGQTFVSAFDIYKVLALKRDEARQKSNSWAASSSDGKEVVSATQKSRLKKVFAFCESELDSLLSNDREKWWSNYTYFDQLVQKACQTNPSTPKAKRKTANDVYDHINAAPVGGSVKLEESITNPVKLVVVVNNEVKSVVVNEKTVNSIFNVHAKAFIEDQLVALKNKQQLEALMQRNKAA